MECEYIQCGREEEIEQVSLGYFAFQHIYWSGLLYLFFMMHLFGRLRLPGMMEPLSTAISQRILLAIVIVCVAVGFFSALKHNRSQWRLAINVLTPYGLYLVLKDAYWTPAYLRAAALIMIGVTLLYAAALFSTPIRQKRNRVLVLKKRSFQLFSVAWVLLRAMLSLLAAVFMICGMFGFSLTAPATARIQADEAEVSGDIEQWREQLQGLEEEQWAGLTLQERIELMQLIADIETDYLGLPDALQVYSLNMPSSTLGLYSHESRSVCISRDHLLNALPEECLDTVLHEVYHSYQHHLCVLYEETNDAYRSMLFLRKAGGYMDEFENYESGEDDFIDYYIQTCEFDARDYAWVRGSEYQHILAFAQS